MTTCNWFTLALLILELDPIYGIIPAPKNYKILNVSATEIFISLPELSDKKNNFLIEASTVPDETFSSFVLTPNGIVNISSLRPSSDYSIMVKECRKTPDDCSLPGPKLSATTPPLRPTGAYITGLTHDTYVFYLPKSQRENNFYRIKVKQVESPSDPVITECLSGFCVVQNLKIDSSYDISLSECVTDDICSEPIRMDKMRTSPYRISTRNTTTSGLVVQIDSPPPSCKLQANVTRADGIGNSAVVKCLDGVCVLSDLMPNTKYSIFVYDPSIPFCGFPLNHILRNTLPEPEITTTSAGWKKLLMPSLQLFLLTVIFRIV